MKSKKARLKDKLDRMIQQIYVPLNPKCLVCGGQTSEMHHYHQKSSSLSLRYNPLNLIPLCRSCHYKHSSCGDATIHQEILRIKGFKWADKLLEEKRKVFKDTLGNLENIYNKLKELG